jgi:hypothetical protein
MHADWDRAGPRDTLCHSAPGLGHDETLWLAHRVALSLAHRVAERPAIQGPGLMSDPRGPYLTGQTQRWGEMKHKASCEATCKNSLRSPESPVKQTVTAC